MVDVARAGGVRGHSSADNRCATSRRAYVRLQSECGAISMFKITMVVVLLGIVALLLEPETVTRWLSSVFDNIPVRIAR